MAEKDKAAVPTSAPTKTLDPFTAFRSEMDRLIDGFFGNRAQFGLPSFDVPDLRVGGVSLSPNVDVKEDEQSIAVMAELPGLSDKDIEVTLKDGMLTLKGEKREEKTDAEARITERRYGRFQRSFRLPDGVDEAKVTAAMENGVLRITVPKNPAAAPKSRSIPIGKAA